MATEVVLPRLGWTMETGSLVEWLKRDGEHVQAGEPLFSVEGEKAVQEVEALESGILRIHPAAPKPGTEVPVGTVLGYILQPGETAPFEHKAGAALGLAMAATPPPLAPEPQTTAAGRERQVVRRPGPAISPRARRVAEELGVDWASLRGSGRTGRIVERDVRQAAAARERAPAVAATPVARRLAARAQVDLDALAQRKPGGKITREDVAAAIAEREAAAVAPPAAGELRPITPLRRVIAHRMLESAQATAAVTLTTEADVTELVVLRERIKAACAARDKPVPTYTDMFIRLTSLALLEHPLLNATWTEEGIVVPSSVHIAVAVDTEAGLMVPVVRDATSKSLYAIARETRRLAEQARARQLAPDDLQGGTFTITNLGTYGIDAFTPLINLPQCAVLGVGRILQKPAVWNEQVVPRHMVALSLTFDHRVVDGGPAARFLATVREYAEQPYLWIGE